MDVKASHKLDEALGYVREGDTLVVTKLDRLARSVAHLLEVLAVLTDKGAALRILDMGIDTSTPTGRLMLTVLGGVAEFERSIMLERQREGTPWNSLGRKLNSYIRVCFHGGTAQQCCLRHASHPRRS